jgi:hypothetical protein
MRSLGFFVPCLAGLILLADVAAARPTIHDLRDGSAPPSRLASGGDLPRVATPDTAWLADWSFDGPGDFCDEAGWQKLGPASRNDGSNYWSVGTNYSGQGFVQGHAAELRKHDLCWGHDGYGNSWDYSVVLRYRGASTLSFDFLSDSEPGFDFVTVEADSECSSNARAAASGPHGVPADFRSVLFTADGPNPSGRVLALALPDFGLAAATHCAYIRFSSDDGFSDEDGQHPSLFSAGLVVDGITVTGGETYSENFESATLDPHVTLVNSALLPVDQDPFARLVHHPLDTDPVGENPTCAWVFTNPSLPCSPPGCVDLHIDNTLLGPWVPLRGSGPIYVSHREWPSPTTTCLSTVWAWSVRSRTRIDNTDTPDPGDSVDCAGLWRGGNTRRAPNSDSWQTVVRDLTTLIEPGAVAVQLRFRVDNWPDLAGFPHSPSCGIGAGAGPYLDRVRLGRGLSPTDAPPPVELAVPSATELHPITPNPCNPSATIRFDLSRDGRVRVDLYDVTGRRVRQLVDRDMKAGRSHVLLWDGRNDSGQRAASGVYICRLASVDATLQQRVVLLQ